MNRRMKITLNHLTFMTLYIDIIIHKNLVYFITHINYLNFLIYLSLPNPFLLMCQLVWVFCLQSNLLVQFLPTLILLAVSTILPNIVYYSDQLIGHWTRSVIVLPILFRNFHALILLSAYSQLCFSQPSMPYNSMPLKYKFSLKMVFSYL